MVAPAKLTRRQQAANRTAIHGKDEVEAMLRDIAYVLQLTRKMNPVGGVRKETKIEQAEELVEA